MNPTNIPCTRHPTAAWLVCPALSALARAFVLLIALLPAAALPQDTNGAPRQQYLDLIAATEVEAGIYARELLEPLTALGTLYREQGAYQQATATLLRARQLLRVNQGLSTLDEIPLLLELRRIAEEQGDLRSAVEYEQVLLVLAQEHSGAWQTWPVFLQVAQQRMTLLERYRAGERPPQIIVGCYYAKTIDFNAIASGAANVLRVPLSDSECLGGNRKTVQLALLIEAISYQGLALEALLQNDRYASDELLLLMTDFFRSSDLLHRLMNRGSEYFIGPVWDRVLGFEGKDSADRVRRAQMQLLLADLNLLRLGRNWYFDDYDQLYGQYRNVYQRLLDEGTEPELMAGIFTPSVPVMLPVYRQSGFTVAEGEGQGEYIDARFEVDERGKSRRIRIVSMTDGVTRADRRKLERFIREGRFRPRLVDGSAVESVTAVVRYPVGEASALPARASINISGIEIQ
ncbi:MAG TPA: tetratricopeptide repeat protein [Pseudomonadaceae bacterium]|nr:tetratricopeptide repeat protein [Pseudomonadaceae bacterium]